MFCIKCGTQLEDGDLFCGKCGAPVAGYEEPAEPAPLKAMQEPLPQPAEPPIPEPVPFEAEPMPTPPPGVFKPDGEPEEDSPAQKAAIAPVSAAATDASVPIEEAAPVKKQLPASYRAISVMEYGDYDWPFVYPGISEDGRIIEEPADHGLGMVIAKTLDVSCLAKGESKYKTVMRVSDIKMEVYVTDARVIFLCDQYDKGGTWSGGLTAVALTAIERGEAKARTRGKTLAGHIRYEWLKHIMYIRKNGMLSSEALRLIYSDRSGNYWCVEVDFNKSVDSSVIANDIMHRAAFLRANLNNDEGVIPETSMQFYREHAQADAIIEHNPAKNTYSSITFPENYKAPGAEGLNPEWS